jgi:hypothetical protein
MIEYRERDIEALDVAGDFYVRHVSAMTAEGLHDKMDIAAELAYRDYRIHNLEVKIHELKQELFHDCVKNNANVARVKFLEAKLKESI